MGRFKFLCSVILVITVPVFVLTLSQNLTFRLPDVYLYYFNDSQVLSKIYTSLTNAEMADAIADFMNSHNPVEFQVFEPTGYDELAIFDVGDSYFMMVLKRLMDISGILCVVALILTVAIYILFLKNEEKTVLRSRFKIWGILSAALLCLQGAAICLPGMRAMTFRFLGLRVLPEDSRLQIILNGDYWQTAGVFLSLIGVIILALLIYIHYRLTKPPRIFY